MNPNSSVVVKILAERLGRGEVAAFRREMQAVLRMDQPRIVFDFCSVTHLDSAGIESLLHCLSAIVKRDGELKLAALSPQATMILEITRVGRFFEVFPTVEDAVRSFDVFVPNTHDFPEPWNLFRAPADPQKPDENLTVSPSRQREAAA